MGGLGKERLFGLAGMFLVFLLMAIFPDTPRELSLRTFDQYQKLSPRIFSPSRDSAVFIVDVDERAYRHFQGHPLGEGRLEDLINRLRNAGVRVVVLDYFMPGDFPDRPGTTVTEDGDVALAGLVRAMKAVSVVMVRSANGDPEMYRGHAIPAKAEITIPYEVNLENLTRGTGLELNDLSLEDAARGSGVGVLGVQLDGIVRGVQMVLMAGGDVQLSLEAEAVRVDAQSRYVELNGDAHGLQAVKLSDDVVIPVDASGYMWVHFAKPARERYVSMLELLDETRNLSFLSNRIVVIGTTAVGKETFVRLPMGQTVSGADAHAQIIEAMLGGGILRRTGIEPVDEALIVLGASVLMLLVLPMLPNRAWLPAFCVLDGAIVWAGWHMFAVHKVLLGTTFPALALFLIFTLMLYGRTWTSVR